MKINFKGGPLLLCAAATVMCLSAAGCSQNNFVNGPEYIYHITDKTDNYVINTTGSTVVVDDGILIDGVFDEDFYDGRNWLCLNKIFEQSGQTETGTLEMTTYFSETGIVVAAHIIDSRPAIYSEAISTGNQTCFSGYFAFDDATTVGNDVYEVECTASNMFKISEFVSGGLNVMYTGQDVTPVHAVRRIGDITKGECYEYYVEYFMPYALFGRETCTETVYFNPTMISATLDAYGNSENSLRTWYNFGVRQSSLYGWGKPNSGYVFNSRGFISNDIIITATGGTVTEEWGYDWCITGDVVNFSVTPEEGKQLVSLIVNGRDYTISAKNGKLSYVSSGDIEIVAEFK